MKTEALLSDLLEILFAGGYVSTPFTLHLARCSITLNYVDGLGWRTTIIAKGMLPIYAGAGSASEAWRLAFGIAKGYGLLNRLPVDKEL